jgi:hypothetical protein
LTSDEEAPVDNESTEPSSLDQLIRRLLIVLTEHKGMSLLNNIAVSACTYHVCDRGLIPATRGRLIIM